MKLTYTQTIERKITKTVIKVLVANGFYMDVFDTEEQYHIRSNNVDAIMEKLTTTDESYAIVFSAIGTEIGWVRFVFGNGFDVICDYTTSLEAYLKPINEWIDKRSN